MSRLILCLTFLCWSSVSGQTCLQRAQEIAPPLTRETRREFEAKLAEARKNAEAEPTADNLIWLGRRSAYLGHYKDAIKIFTDGAEKFPDGRQKEAESVVGAIKPDLDVIENADYYKLIRLYQGRTTAAELLKEISDGASPLSKVSIGYGLGNSFLYNDQRAEAEKIFRHIILGNQWASFGHIAAEAELSR